MDWKQFDRQRWQFLRYAQREFRIALNRQARQGIEAIKKGVDVEYAVTEKPIKDAFIKVYRRTGGHFAKETFRRYAKSEDEVWLAEIMKWIETDGAQKITAISQTTKNEIKRILEAGVREGQSIQQMADLIQNKVGSANRATLIARTEIVSASNLGSLEGARSTGLPMKKLWLSTPDGRTRGMEPGDIFDHTDVKPVDNLDGLFIVSGEHMEYPGDSSHGASIGNTIQCRCVVGYEPY